MTIEAKLDALTAAVIGLTAAVLAASGAQTATPAQPDAKPTEKAAATPATTTAPATPTPPAAPQEGAKALTYDDVKVPFLALVKKNRDLALATLKPFGLESLKPAKPEQFAAILAALNNALAS